MGGVVSAGAAPPPGHDRDSDGATAPAVRHLGDAVVRSARLEGMALRASGVTDEISYRCAWCGWRGADAASAREHRMAHPEAVTALAAREARLARNDGGRRAPEDRLARLARHAPRQPEARTCVECGTEFVTTHPRKKFCKTLCEQRHTTRRRRERGVR